MRSTFIKTTFLIINLFSLNLPAVSAEVKTTQEQTELDFTVKVWLVKTDNNGKMLWHQTDGINKNGSSTAIIQTEDKGFMLAGYTRNLQSNQFWLIKLDQSGKTIWEQSYPGVENSISHLLYETQDGGYAVTGKFAGENIWLIKTDANGFLEWSQNYFSSQSQKIDTIKYTSDGSFVMTGYVDDPNSIYNSDVTLIKTDEIGNIVSNFVYVDDADVEGNDIVETNDGGYAILSTVLSEPLCDDDSLFNCQSNTGIRLLKMDNSGNLEWQQTFARSDGDEGASLIQTNDDGFVLVGKTSNDSLNHWIIKTKSNGDIQWDYIFGNAEAHDISGIIETEAGNYAIGTNTFNVNSQKMDMLLLKIGRDGNLEWEENYGSSGEDRTNAIIQTQDTGFALAGSSNSFNEYVQETRGRNIDFIDDLDTNNELGDNNSDGIDKYGQVVETTLSDNFTIVMRFFVVGVLVLVLSVVSFRIYNLKKNQL